MDFETLAVHGGEPDHGGLNPSAYPIYLASTFGQPSTTEFGEYMYSRSKNPTRNHVETLAADLEGSAHALAMASGMAANALAFSLVGPGERVLLNSNVYGGTWNIVSRIFGERGIAYDIVTDFGAYDFSRAPEDATTVFLESPSNPLLDVTDIADVARRAHERGLRVVVDNTFMTSYLQRPLDLGADVVTYSATKYYSGHSDVIAGLVCVNDEALFERLKFNQKSLGGILDPFSSFLLARGIETLPLRMDRQQANAQAVAEHLLSLDGVERVYYPGLPTHPGYDVQRRQARGAGACLSAVFDGSRVDVDAFARGLRIFSLAVSLGSVESLVCLPATMTHEEYSPELQRQIGIVPDLLRFSVGVESEADLVADIDQAYRAALRG